MKRCFFLLISFGLSITLYSQAPHIEWQKTLGGSGNEYAQSIQQTADGGFIVAGHSDSEDGHRTEYYGFEDFWIVKLNTYGNIQWQKTFGGSGNDMAYSVSQTMDGGYIVAGSTNSTDGDVSENMGDHDYWVIKLNSTGDLEWEKSLGGSSYERAYSIKQTSDGGYIIAGRSDSFDGDVTGSYGIDYWVVKLDETGNIQWEKTVGGSGIDQANSVIQTLDGGHMVAGFSYASGGDISEPYGDGYSCDIWIVKLNADGDLQWEKSLGGSQSDFGFSIVQTPEGGYIIAGSSESDDIDVSENKGSSDVWVVKIDDIGQIEWEKSFGGSGFDRAYAVNLTSDGGYIVAGTSHSNDFDVSHNYEHYDFWVIKLNADGDLIWEKSYGGTGFDQAFSAQQTTDGGYIIAGWTDSVDGDITIGRGFADMWIVKLSPEATNLNDISPSNAVACYPNPANDFIYIEGLVPGSPILITNLLGEVVYNNSVENHIQHLDISQLANGFYFINKKYKFIKL